MTFTLTNDNGQPQALNPAAPPTIRYMGPTVAYNVANASDHGYARTIVDPGGATVVSDPSYCWKLTNFSDDLPYRGNGTYTVTVTEYGDADCKSTPKATQATFTIAAGVAIAAPAGPVLTRAPNSFTTNVQQLGFTGNPGRFVSYEIRYALGGVIGSNGAISGPSQLAFVNTAGNVELRLDRPGTYVVVARATSGDYSTAWSAPVNLKAVAPFDLTGTTFPDARGPTYRVRGIVREKSAAGGRVTLSAAKGKKRGRFRPLGSSRVRSGGTFSIRFRIRNAGFYRLRYRFKGTDTVLPGSVTELVRIRRRVFFK